MVRAPKRHILWMLTALGGHVSWMVRALGDVSCGCHCSAAVQSSAETMMEASTAGFLRPGISDATWWGGCICDVAAGASELCLLYTPNIFGLYNMTCSLIPPSRRETLECSDVYWG
ncbi:hypothetical protein GDO81_029785 [Engystomops pustulosus]|uniref:Secreted protein n=1 Tax=Engystomops pustulosus TaxID=76066 RepID=A0AAV6YFS3_ENGPU|nr:hypothetical protein GDO81_029785 [Engystomops pustulosus]